jgi:hypothetical protein
VGPPETKISPLKLRLGGSLLGDDIPSLFSASKRRKIDDASTEAPKPWRQNLPKDHYDDSMQQDNKIDIAKAKSVVVIDIDDAETPERGFTPAAASSSSASSNFSRYQTPSTPVDRKAPTYPAAPTPTSVKYVTPIRKKEDRERLPGHACEDCAKVWYRSWSSESLSVAYRFLFCFAVLRCCHSRIELCSKEYACESM